MRKVIAVDFDGTLFENAWPGIGAPRVNVIAAALQEQQNGAALILWTCRTGEALRAALKACEAQGLHFDAVNDSLPEWKDSFDGDPRKIGATEYWDDRAVNPDRTPGFPTGEPLTLEQLRHMDEQPVLYDGTCFIVRLNYPIYGDAIVYCDDLLILLDEAVEHGVYAYYPPARIDMEAWGCPLCNRSRVISFKAWEDEEAYQEGGPFVQGGALFCPRCGKPRTPEARAELEKRLRR